MASEEKKYHLSLSKQTSTAGELLTIQTVIPGDSTQEDLNAEVVKLGEAVTARLVKLNESIEKKTGMAIEKWDALAATGIHPSEVQ